ncbi:MAG TPA: metallophosphoesterase, partial [Panacibacter sp.]|nr:metallophosphoesterase [Panacibacter sp.]
MQIAIIHVTDIHFTTNSDYNARALPFCQAVTSSIRGINKIYFVLSGDIAFSGSEDEYEIAIKYFSICKQLLKQENKNLEIKFVIVPGNHDCSFNGDTHLRRNIVASMNYKILGNDNSVIDECTKIQSNFWNFYSKYNQIPEDKLFYKINDVVEQKQIAFYCINTAWMSSIDEKAGTLFFPVKRYHEFERGLNEISFGVWHHPYNWFNPSTSENNKKEFELFTESISETHFFGHEHQQSF